MSLSIKENLRDLRRLAGLTQEQAAQQVGLTRQAISSYESGRTQPDLDTLEALAKVYGAEITDVLYGTGQRQKALRFWRRAPFLLAAVIVTLVGLRSALLLGINSFLAIPQGLADQETLAELTARRFALLDAGAALGGLAGAVSLIGCLVLGVRLFLARPLPPVKGGFAFLLILAGGFLLLTLPFAALDGVYQAADYLWPGLSILPPAALLALWWGLLTLLRQERG